MRVARRFVFVRSIKPVKVSNWRGLRPFDRMCHIVLGTVYCDHGGLIMNNLLGFSVLLNSRPAAVRILGCSTDQSAFRRATYEAF
jgi:hypothetical protein